MKSHGFLYGKLSRIIKKSFGIKIINKNEPIIQLNSTTDSVASILIEQLNENERNQTY